MAEINSDDDCSIIISNVEREIIVETYETEASSPSSTIPPSTPPMDQPILLETESSETPTTTPPLPEMVFEEQQPPPLPSLSPQLPTQSQPPFIIEQQPPTSKSQDVSNSPADDKKSLCRDYVRGACTRHICKYIHEENHSFLSKSTINFCHDFQNTNCTRPHCKYIHCTSAEEKHYYETGELPICKDFLENKCERGAKCIKRHVGDPNASLSTTSTPIMVPPPGRPLTATIIPLPRGPPPPPPPPQQKSSMPNIPVVFDPTVRPPALPNFITPRTSDDFHTAGPTTAVMNSQLSTNASRNSSFSSFWTNQANFTQGNANQENNNGYMKRTNSFYDNENIETQDSESKRMRLSDESECGPDCPCKNSNEDEAYWENKMEILSNNLQNLLDQLTQQRIEILRNTSNVRPPLQENISFDRNISNSQFETSQMQINLPGNMPSMQPILAFNNNQPSASNVMPMTGISPMICNSNNNSQKMVDLGTCSPCYIVFAPSQQLQVVNNSNSQQQQQPMLSSNHHSVPQTISIEQPMLGSNHQTVQQPIAIDGNQLVLQGQQISNQQLPGSILMLQQINNKGS